MEPIEHASERIPAIFVFEGTTAAHSIFNPNEWSDDSKAVIASCSAQFALLLFANSALSRAHEGVARICAQRVDELQRQWRVSRWDLERLRYFVEVPSVHLSIQAFLVTVKTLLDLMAQLLTSERVVHTKMHGRKNSRLLDGAKGSLDLTRSSRRATTWLTRPEERHRSCGRWR